MSGLHSEGLLEREVQTTNVTISNNDIKYEFSITYCYGLDARVVTILDRTLSDQKGSTYITFRRKRGRNEYGKLEGPLDINPVKILCQMIKEGDIIYLHSKKELPKEIIKTIEDALKHQSMF